MTLARTWQLIEGAVEGGQTSYGMLLERIRPRLVIWCAGRLSTGLRAKVEADDVAQEVLLAVHRALPSYRPPAGNSERAFFGWVFRIAENRIRDLVDYHGAAKRQPRPPLSFTQTTPSRAAQRVETTDRVQRAIQQLSEDHRMVLQLRRVEERGLAEVAEVMGRSVPATKMLYWRAVEALGRVLAENS